MENKSSTSTVVSIRLSQEERQLIEDAAASRGWKAANLIRVSALERAAHVLNLSRPTSFDFAGLAKRLAETLVAARTVGIADRDTADMGMYLGTGSGQFGAGPLDLTPPTSETTLAEVVLLDFKPAALTSAQVEELQTAVRLGGAEFLSEVIEQCRRLGNEAKDSNLPSPIDPQNLKD